MRDRWPRYPLARSSTTRRFLWALTARFTRAISSTPWRQAGLLCQQLLDLLDVRRGDRHFPSQPPGDPGRLVLEQVPAVRATAQHLSGTSQPEPLSRSAVRLHLWHVAVDSISIVLLASGAPLRGALWARRKLPLPGVGPAGGLPTGSRGFPLARWLAGLPASFLACLGAPLSRERGAVLLGRVRPVSCRRRSPGQPPGWPPRGPGPLRLPASAGSAASALAPLASAGTAPVALAPASAEPASARTALAGPA